MQLAPFRRTTAGNQIVALHLAAYCRSSSHRMVSDLWTNAVVYQLTIDAAGNLGNGSRLDDEQHATQSAEYLLEHGRRGRAWIFRQLTC
jgi:hypothetical protein